MNHYNCFYHVHCGKHVNYHHVIMYCSPEEIINLEEENYLYLLRTTKLVHLSPEQFNDSIVQGLIMDGESLLKRIKKQINHSKTNESLSV